MKLSIIMPCYNEANYISRSLESILANDFPKSDMELLIYDGGSIDATSAILERYSRKYPFIKIRNNPKKIQAAAMNLGIKESQGEIIIRMDAHTLYADDYISQIVKLLTDTDAVNVGGGQVGKGKDYFTRAVALAMSNPFIAGNALYRLEKEKDVYTDTVYLGAWRKDDLIRAGGFDEHFVVNEDYELNYRLRANGGKILFSPKIKSEYLVRGTLGGIAKQYFRYGFWKVRTLKKHPRSLKYRQLAAPLFALSVAIGAIAFFQGYNFLFYGLLLAYILAFSLYYKSRVRYIAITLILAFVIHSSWGIGFWAGIVYWSLRGR